ncbi:MAG: hypothetical protein FJ267_05805, partial [Planctomycetes bacterium]|nr:hypothetical protein [Planctomycetota bacterium]
MPSRDFRLSVYDLPELVRSDLLLTFPSHTGLDPKRLDDAFEATVVEGTVVTMTCRVNKPLKSATLVDRDETRYPMQADSANDRIFSLDFQPKSRHRLKLELADDAGRMNREPEEFRIDAVPNQRPEIAITFPGQDVKVSPLEELRIESTLTDDFGLVESGIAFQVPGRDEISIPFDGVSMQLKFDSQHVQYLEELKVSPDELISFYVFATDYDSSGKIRKTASDLFFAEIRPFEEVFRQLDAPPGGQSPMAGGNQQGNPLDKLIQLQKQIVVATWNVTRQDSQHWDESIAEKIRTISQSQTKARENCESLGERFNDAKFQPIMSTIIQNMISASSQLELALEKSELNPLYSATGAEQSAYQGLLKLRAREHLMMQGQQGSSGSGSSSSPSQQQLGELELSNKQNRYETERQSQERPNSNNREDLAILDRLKELARRQQGLNEQLRELDGALRTAKTDNEREELQRQLKRLRDEQQQLLHDSDELRNKMSQANNQERLSDSRQQLEQTRQQLVDAAEKLREGRLSQALNSGTRAEKELQKLHEEFRQRTAAQFADAMRSLREEARRLFENEKQLAEKLEAIQSDAKKTLRQTRDRQGLENEFSQQRQLLNQLTQSAREVTEKAESAEPLLSKQLYDSLRSLRDMKTEQALDAATQLLRAGFLPEATKAEAQAQAGIERLKQGIEKAAEGILGDEVETLKRARAELAELSKE